MKCKKHPKYKAIRKPMCDCKKCWGSGCIKNQLKIKNKLTLL